MLDVLRRQTDHARVARRAIGLSVLVVLAALATGCKNKERIGLSQDPNVASRHYERGDYAKAFTRGRAVARYGAPGDRALGAYIAGLSAKRLGDDANAIEMLRRATRADEDRLAADAAATLGMLYAERGRYAEAAHELLRAAERYAGEDRAQAYFHAAVSQQKLGRWPQARTNLVLARAASSNPAFWQRVAEQLEVTGYTIQAGAFRDAANAQRAAADLAARAGQLGLDPPRLIDTSGALGEPVTLLQVGAFGTFGSALSFSERLGADDAVIVPLAGP